MASIFNISEMVSLALHSIIIIAVHTGQLVNVKKIAKKIGASEAHLAKVLQQLVKGGYISSVRGPKGGFALAKAPDDITLFAIYELFEGPIEIEGCPMNCQNCAFKSCILGKVPQKLNQEFLNYLNNHKVSDFLGELA
ncbi:MAG: Rrf2 family transcriptional regulator [Halanaerobiales bacterium]|nr:Rrf2 family transcriptional regulator [Halanaerobiales bacterium]